MKKILLLVLIISSTLQTYAFEDYILSTKGKLTNISIEDNTIVDVYPLITIMNNKNTLFISPLKIGKTRFSVLKNGKEKVIFNVEIEENKTFIKEVEGFEMLSLDMPEESNFVLDEPPMLREIK